MAPKEQKKGSDAEEVKKGDLGGKGKAQPSGKGDAPPKSSSQKQGWLLIIAKIAYTGLAALTALVAVGVIIVSLITILLTQAYTADQSGHVAGLVVVLVSAFVAIAVLVYAVVAVFKKKKKGLFYVSLVLLVIGVVQVSLAVATVNLSPNDQATLSSSLQKVYTQSRSNDMKAIKQYHLVESSAQCCGYNGANDYKLANVYATFPPDVPISCCPSYDSEKSDFAQEKAREVCRQNRIYYSVGCSGPAMDKVTTMSDALLQTLITEAVLELVLVILGLLAYFFGQKLLKSKDDPSNP